MYGSVHVHMVYSVRAKLAVRITARFVHDHPKRFYWSPAVSTPLAIARICNPATARSGVPRTISRADWEAGVTGCRRRALRWLAADRQQHAPRMYLRYTFYVLSVQLRGW